MIYPSADTIEDKVKSRYSLVVLAAKRAKQIKEGAPILIDTDSTNPLTIALEEIAAGKVTAIEAEGEMVPTAANGGAAEGPSSRARTMAPPRAEAPAAGLSDPGLEDDAQDEAGEDDAEAG